MERKKLLYKEDIQSSIFVLWWKLELSGGVKNGKKNNYMAYDKIIINVLLKK